VSRATVNLVAFVVVMIVVPWSLIWLLRTAGRRWGTGIQDLESRPATSQRPLHCRLNLFHHWRTVHPPGEAPYPALPRLRQDPRDLLGPPAALDTPLFRG
jgi:hypothetical protein